MPLITPFLGRRVSLAAGRRQQGNGGRGMLLRNTKIIVTSKLR